jgi:hypothetical protein
MAERESDRRQHDRRRGDRRNGLVLVQGSVPRHVYGREAVENVRRACFLAQGLKTTTAYRVMSGRARPMETLVALAGDLIPRKGGLMAASYLTAGAQNLLRFIRAAEAETRPAMERRALQMTWDDNHGGAA